MFKILTYFCSFWQIWTSNSVTCPPYNPNVVVLLPHEYMCTWYYQCEQNGPVLMECWPPGTHFSPNTNRCEWESVANCTLPGVPPPSTTTLVTTTNLTTYPLTTPTTITKIPTTTTTIPTVPTLPTTITTMPTITTTTTPVTTSSFIIPTVATSIGFTIPTVPVATTTKTILTTSTPTTSTITSTQPPPECPEVDDPNVLIFLPNPVNCSLYFLCFNGEKLRRNCAEGFYWDVDNKWCNVRNEVNCGSVKDQQ